MDKLLSIVRSVYDNNIIGIAYENRDEEVRKQYPNLSDAQYYSFSSRKYLCQEMAWEVMKLLDREKIQNHYVMIYTKWLNINPDRKFGFNSAFLNHIQNKDFAAATAYCFSSISPADTYNCSIAAHSLVEAVDRSVNKVYLLDPYCGMVYGTTKEELIRNPQLVFDSYAAHGQLFYLLGNIHINRSNLLAASPVFWINVRHISNSPQGDFHLKS